MELVTCKECGVVDDLTMFNYTDEGETVNKVLLKHDFDVGGGEGYFYCPVCKKSVYRG